MNTYDKSDLANGYYNHLPRVSERGFAFIAAWLTTKGAPASYRLFAEKAVGIIAPGDTPNAFGLLPTMVEWNIGHVFFQLDAAQVFHYPHVALTELKKNLGFGNPNVLEFYPGERQFIPTVVVSPIGSAWPEKGLDAYRSIGAGAGDTYSTGTIWTEVSGSYRKEEHGWWVVKYAIWRKVA